MREILIPVCAVAVLVGLGWWFVHQPTGQGDNSLPTDQLRGGAVTAGTRRAVLRNEAAAVSQTSRNREIQRADVSAPEEVETPVENPAVDGVVEPGRYRIEEEGSVESLAVFRPVALAGTDDAYVVGTNELGYKVGFRGGTAFVANGSNATDLDSPADGWSVALGVNGGGSAVGSSASATAKERPVLWLPTGEAVELDTLGGAVGRANGINGSGMAVGWALTEGGAIQAAAWDRYGRVTNLNQMVAADGGWELKQAFRIDDEGNILAIGAKDGQDRQVRLTPQFHDVERGGLE